MSLKITLIAGEASGDNLGGALMAALKAQRPDIAFSGIGGPQMEAQGLQSLFPMQELSLMGIAEIVPKLRKLLRRIDQTADFIADMKPDIVITIDAPDFCTRVVRKARPRVAARFVHYVAPTVWAWRPERAAKMAALYDGLICLLPFEPAYFEKEGMSACFAGHPLLENSADVQNFRAKHSITEDIPILGLLFGSRKGEFARTAPDIASAARMIVTPQTVIVAPTLPHMQARVEALLDDMPCRCIVVTEDKQAAFAATDAAVAVSGTVALELAVAGVPHIIAYRMNPLTWKLVRPRIKLDYAHLANILLGRLVVPEFLQGDCQPKAMAAAVRALMDRGSPEAVAQREAFRSLKAMLAGSGDGKPSEQAADYVLGLVGNPRTRRG